MHTIEIFNVGNGNSALVTLKNGRTLLVDFCDRVSAEDTDDPKIDLGEHLLDKFAASRRDSVDVFAVTHLDEDHICGFSDFFHLEHAKKYQGARRIKIKTLWVPAGVLFEGELGPEAGIVQAEARYRLREAVGIRVFSRPEALRDWCGANGVDFEARQHLMTDAGRCAQEFALSSDEMECFLHSPLARRIDGSSGGQLIDRNQDCLVFQARFSVLGATTDVLFTGDMTAAGWESIVAATKEHGNEDRLAWDLYAAPHHCSYKSIGPERGRDQTEPTTDVCWLLEDQGRPSGYIVSSSEPIPNKGSGDDESDQPPHRQAAEYYKRVVGSHKFLVTMEEPTPEKPKPIVFEVRHGGLKRVTVSTVSGLVASTPVGRAG